MLPAVSAEDCLFADLGIDPAIPGCQSFEATDFLVHERWYDPRCHLILWQAGVIGDVRYRTTYDSRVGLRMLQDFLLERAGDGHQLAIYEAARYPVCPPRIDWVPLRELVDARVTPISTLYVPPAVASTPSRRVMEALGIPASYVRAKEALSRDIRLWPLPSARVS